MADTASRYSVLYATSSAGASHAEYVESLIRSQIDQRRLVAEDNPLNTGLESSEPALSVELQADSAVLFHLRPKKQQARTVLLPLQEWEGYVTDVRRDGFTAQLVDLTDDDRIPGEEADFALGDLSDADLPLLREGAVFRWTIGYLKSPSGTKRRVSQVVFRRLPQWTKREIAAADRQAEQLVSSIRWE